LNRQKKPEEVPKEETKIEIKEENVAEKPAEIAPKRVVEVQRAVASNGVAPVYASKESGLQELDIPPLNMAPPNRNFVFHNKMPKCGGTSMKYILWVLSEDNDFYLDYQPPCLGDRANCARNGDDGTDGQLELARHVTAKRAEKPDKFFLLKHHHWMNFTDVGLEQPTYVNVIRHPMGRFNSVYYFQRYGFAKMGTDERQGARHTWKGSQEDFDQTLDECVAKKSDECFEPTQVMVSYFCGTQGKTNEDRCKVKDPKNVTKWGHRNDWNKLRRATDIAKNHVVKNYYMIGILEHFNETLTLFSKMLPEYFEGAHAAKHDPWAVQFGSSSKTAKNPGYSQKSADILMAGPLRYEMELYNLCQKIFYERLKYYKIELGEEVVFDKTKHSEFIPRHVHLKD